MNRVIYKYKITPPESGFNTSVVAPYFMQPISVGEQNGDIFIWGISPPLEKIEADDKCSHEFLIVPTGVEFTFNRETFLGTVQLKTLSYVGAALGLPLSGQLVFHVFYVGRKNL